MTLDVMPRCYILKCNRRFFHTACFAASVLLLFMWLSLHTQQFVPSVSVNSIEFLWLRNASRNVSVYLSPEKTTTLLEPEDVCPHPLDYLIVIPSAPANRYQRDIIRRTWGTWVYSSVGNSSLKLLFMIGLTAKDNATIGDVIYSESSQSNDIIVEDFMDSYLNLTLKSVFILKWVQSKCPNIQYLMKADDDMFINVPILVSSMRAMKLPKRCMVGSTICNAHPVHNMVSKWFTPKYMYTKTKYPNYLSGTAYVISGGVVGDLYRVALRTPYFHLEDIFLTGLCAEKLKLARVDHPGFSLLPSAKDPCRSIDFVSRQETSSDGVLKRWKQLHDASLVAGCLAKPKKKVKRKKNPKGCKWK